MIGTPEDRQHRVIPWEIPGSHFLCTKCYKTWVTWFEVPHEHEDQCRNTYLERPKDRFPSTIEGYKHAVHFLRTCAMSESEINGMDGFSTTATANLLWEREVAKWESIWKELNK